MKKECPYVEQYDTGTDRGHKKTTMFYQSCNYIIAVVTLMTNVGRNQESMHAILSKKTSQVSKHLVFRGQNRKLRQGVNTSSPCRLIMRLHFTKRLNIRDLINIC